MVHGVVPADDLIDLVDYLEEEGIFFCFSWWSHCLAGDEVTNMGEALVPFHGA